jgi:hypothetical protein
MAMRSFIKTSDMSLAKVTSQMHRRLEFLRGKLIEDLEQGAKSFVYKNMYRDLDEGELARLHAAVRKFGNNWLLYVRRQTADCPHGTVRIAAPGLMIGYIDHFAFSPKNEPLGHNTEGWLELCKRAYTLRSAS